MKTRRRITAFLLTGLMVLGLCACGKGSGTQPAVPDNTVPSQRSDIAPTKITERRFAFELLNDDWAAYFRYEYVPENKNPYVYSFVINNMRYRCNEEWTETWTENRDKDGKLVYDVSYTLKPVKSWFSINDARRTDRKKISDLFAGSPSPEQLLALKVDSLQFEELDKDLFFRLIRKAFTEDQKAERDMQKHRLDYFYSMEYESSFRDDYKFQICYLMSLPGYLEKIVIDVLYKTGEAYNDYDQLSDLVRDGRASTEQQEAYAFIRKIEDAVVAQNRFDALSDEYEDLEIGGIDFSRLWQFMQDLETGAILSDSGAKYNWEKNRPVIHKEMTAEEFATREVPAGIGETP